MRVQVAITGLVASGADIVQGIEQRPNFLEELQAGQIGSTNISAVLLRCISRFPCFTGRGLSSLRKSARHNRTRTVSNWRTNRKCAFGAQNACQVGSKSPAQISCRTVLGLTSLFARFVCSLCLLALFAPHWLRGNVSHHCPLGKCFSCSIWHRRCHRNIHELSIDRTQHCRNVIRSSPRLVWVGYPVCP